MADILKYWDEIKESVRVEHGLSPISYNTWIKPLNIFKVEDNKIIIMIPIDKAQSVGYISSKYTLPFKVAISEILKEDKEYDIEFILEKDAKNYKPSSDNILFERANLNSKYTFDTFIIGSSNSIAHSAALAVAESPGMAYNPLFIYGGVGLGKTHLMHSIAHMIIEENNNAKVMYITSQEWTNEVIDNIKIGKNSPTAMKNFREKYKNVDVLLIDDIQFIMGKESTQEEFFFTFNQLLQDNKQIVISSDKPPKDMDNLDERYKSRFVSGLIVDIQKPDYETRVAILERKQETEGYKIDKEVIEYIADNVNSNIRELEGSLNKLIALSNLTKKEIDLNLAQNALKDIISPNVPKNITPEYILDIVIDHFGISLNELKSKKRNAEIVYPRQLIMYLCDKYTDAPLKSIASLIGKNDHTTVIHGRDKIADEILRNENVRNTVDILIKKINPD